MKKKTKATIANISRSKSKITKRKRKRKQNKDEIRLFYYLWAERQSAFNFERYVFNNMLSVQPLPETNMKYFLRDKK